MRVVEAYYEQGDATFLNSLDEVESFLSRVRSDSILYGVPLLVQWYVVDDEHTPEFCVGVNGDVGLVSYTGRDWPGLWVSRDVEGVWGDDVVVYDYMGNAREFPVDGQIPFTDVLLAAREFLLAGGDRPSSVTWQKYV